tara:strand:- start:1237 stop:1707 length:471 start_codon:yes stop_codon:yes gene_type:complete
MSSDDALVDICRDANYPVEYAKNFDGSEDHSTVVVEFPCHINGKTILAKDMTAIKQLELVKELQTKWSDNSVSVTVYYKLEELDEIKEWMKKNYEKSLKTVSFLLHSDHGFAQAPYEEITPEEYDKRVSRLKEIKPVATGEVLEGVECEGGACPIR